MDVDQLDELHGLVERLVTTRIKLRRGMEESDREVLDELDELDKITSSLQDTVMDMRLVPMKKIVGKFPRLVRDLAREQDKDIDFVVEGDDVELDRTILTEISDPLMHLLRNAVDHGSRSRRCARTTARTARGRSRCPPSATAITCSSKSETTAPASTTTRCGRKPSRKA